MNLTSYNCARLPILFFRNFLHVARCFIQWIIVSAALYFILSRDNYSPCVAFFSSLGLFACGYLLSVIRASSLHYSAKFHVLALKVVGIIAQAFKNSVMSSLPLVAILFMAQQNSSWLHPKFSSLISIIPPHFFLGVFSISVAFIFIINCFSAFEELL